MTLDSSLERELGLDSLARVELVLRLEREFERASRSRRSPRARRRGISCASCSRAAAMRRRPRTARSRAWRSRRACARPSTRRRSPRRSSTTSSASRTGSPSSCTRIRAKGRSATATSGRAQWPTRRGSPRRGLMPGQTVAIMLPTSKEYLFCFYGTLLAGGIPVPLYPPARLTTIEDHLTRHVGILKSCRRRADGDDPRGEADRVAAARAGGIAAGGDGAGGLSSQRWGFYPGKGERGQIGFLQYTSGSTGQPEGRGADARQPARQRARDGQGGERRLRPTYS